MMLEKKTTEKAFSILEKVYSEIPRTRGCEKANRLNGCKAYCCFLQTPSMFFCEFLYLWQNFQKNHDKEKQTEIILKAVKNYLRNIVTKTCIFFDREKCCCLGHKWRPLSCRLYGITHPKSWRNRAKSVKEQHRQTLIKDKRKLSKIIDQCGLIRTVDGRRHVSRKSEEEWFEKTKEAEKMLGVTKEAIALHDKPEGPYRSIHDHLMLATFPIQFLNTLSEQRQDRISEDEIKRFGDTIKQQILTQGKKENG